MVKNISETDLKRIISESVKKVLSEIGDTEVGQYKMGKLARRKTQQGDHKGAREIGSYAYDQNYENNGTLHPTSFETGRLGVKNMVKIKMFDGGSAETQRLGKLCKSLFDVLDQFVESGALTKQEVNYAYIEISKLLTKCEKVDGKYSAY